MANRIITHRQLCLNTRNTNVVVAVQTDTHIYTDRADCYLHSGLCLGPSEVRSVCRVQIFSLLTVVYALASGEKRAAWLSQQSQQFYRSVREKEVDQRRELKSI